MPKLGYHMTEESRAKMSASLVGNTRTLGYHPSVETRAKLSVALTGIVRSPETRAKDSAAHKGYVPTPEARARNAAAQWKGGRAVWLPKQNAKRRAMGYIPLNSVFPGCEGHHVDNELIINMPKVLHRSIYHNQTTGQGMAQINAIAYNFLFKQEVEAALAAKEQS